MSIQKHRLEQKFKKEEEKVYLDITVSHILLRKPIEINSKIQREKSHYPRSKDLRIKRIKGCLDTAPPKSATSQKFVCKIYFQSFRALMIFN